VADGRPFTPYGKVLAKLKEMDDACRGAGDLESSFTIGACIQQVEWLEQSESAPPTGPTPRCDALNKSADRAYWPKWADLAEQLERALTARSATRATIVEECAKVCDDLADDPYFRVSALMQEAARLIRALADSTAVKE
jgi:hypothetical protein